MSSSLNGKAVTGWNAEARGGDRVVLEIVDEKDGVNTLDLDLSDAWEIHTEIEEAAKAAENAAGR